MNPQVPLVDDGGMVRSWRKTEVRLALINFRRPPEGGLRAARARYNANSHDRR
jgi:hypothetical protein